MKKFQRLDQKQITNLIRWYDKSQRSFAWRQNPETYWVWIAEVMSQQTQLVSVAVYLDRFLKAFPTVESLASASSDSVLKLWTGLGYYSRARNVHAAAKQIVLQGGFPKTYEGWLDLPGVGPYTAAAIVSQVFDLKMPVWDGNVLRVCSRLFREKSPYSPEFKTQMMELLTEAMAHVRASQWNQALMELGATICTPKSPGCGRCPLQVQCKSFEKNEVQFFPPPKIRKQVVLVEAKVEVLMQERSGKKFVFLEERKKPKWFSGMWDFPSELGGVKSPKNPIQIGKASKKIGIAKHSITHHKIELHAYVTSVSKRDGSKKGKWIELDDLIDQSSVPVATTTRKVVRLLMNQR